MFSLFERRQRQFSAPIAIFTAALVMLAAPALAGVSIQGVSQGEVVTGDLELRAVSDGPRTRSVSLHVVGPDGTEITNRSDRAAVDLLTDPDQPRRAVAWDTSGYPEGEYTAAAYATEWTRSGRNIATATVVFTIDHPETQNSPTLVVNDQAATDTVKETAAPDDAPTPAAAPQPQSNEQPTTHTADTRDVGLAFDAGAATSRRIGDGRGIKARLLGSAANNSDVLFIVWDNDRREIVKGFKVEHAADADLSVPADQLDRLPVGNLELQAHYRVDGDIRETAKHAFVNQAAAPSANGLPVVRFSERVGDEHTLGSTQNMTFAVDGALPANGDVLVLAWSIDQNKLAPGFAHVFTEGPYEITAAKLNTLPEGLVEIQLRPRVNGKIEGKVVNTISVVKPVTAGLPGGNDGGETPDDGGDAGDGGTDDGNTDAGGEQTAGGDDPSDGGDVNNGTPETPDGSTDGGSANAGSDFDVSFASDTPSQYVLGSGTPITLEATGTLPAGADVLMLMWSNDRGELINSFAHELKGAPFTVDQAKLDALPAGNAELQFLVRVPGEPLAINKRSLRIVDPNAPEPEEPVVDSGGDIDYSNLNLSSSGFTVFTKSSDTQVIYCAANGNDSNDGLSPERPMKTPSKAYKKLRSGKPDWLLFRAGDTFSGNLGSISKTGRSSKEKMVIGVYGNGARPIFHSPDSSWARKEFTTKGDHVAFVGLHIIAINRKNAAERGNASGLKENQWKQSAISYLGDAEDVLIEDCIVEYFKFALVFQSGKDWGFMKDIKIRRSAILNSYGHWDKNIGGHSSGTYIEYVDGLLIEDCVWDSNGWNDRVSGAKRTKFNHNIYVQTDNKNCTVRNNIITRGSAHGLQLRPGGTVDDNLFVSNPLAFYVGRHESWVRRNVVLKSQDMSSDAGEDRGFGMEVLPCLHAHIENNIFSQKAGTAEFAEAIGIKWASKANDWLDGRPYKVSLKDNKVYKWPRYNGRESTINIETPSAQIVENTRNAVDAASGGSSNPPWIDPDRDVETYMKSIGKTPSLDALVKAAAYRPRGQWAEEFSAKAVNLHIRRGFDTQQGD